MTRSVTFNGITRLKPGGIVRINAEALNQIGVSASSVVALIGEADGGVPGAVDGIVTLRDPSRAVDMFKSGPIVDAIRLAFQSSGDPLIPGGASSVLIYKTNQSTQSSIHIANPAATLAQLTMDAGSTTTVLNVTDTLVADEYVGRWVDVAINSLPVLATITATGGSTTEASAAGLVEDQYVGQVVQFDAATSTVALQGEYATIISNDGATITFAETLPAAVAAGDEFDILATFRCRVTDNAVGAVTVSPALPVAPAAGDAVVVRPTLFTVTSVDYGAHTEDVDVDITYSATTEQYRLSVRNGDVTQLSESLGGSLVLDLMYRGGANAVATDTIATPASVTATSLDLTTGGLTPAAHDGAAVVITDPESGESEQVVIDSNLAGSLTLAAPGLSDEFVEILQAAGAGTVLVDIKTVTDAVARVTGSNGVATGLASTITGVVGDDLSMTFLAGETLSQLVSRINQNVNYVASIPAGANGDLLLAADLDFGPSTEVSIQAQPDLNGGLGFKQDLADLLSWVEEVAEAITAERYTEDALDGSMLPRSEVAIDTQFAEPIALLGGTRGVSSNSNWQDGFDALLLEQVDSVVPLIDQDLVEEGYGSSATWASVAAQLSDHVAEARGASNAWRGGYMGIIATKSEFIAAANSLNDEDIALVSQHPTVLNSLGTLVEQTPRQFAVMAASMRSGVSEVGEPLTHKYIRVSGLTQDSSWDPRDTTDAGDLILAGCLFAEVVPGRGTRWVRDLTTWVKNDNLAYSEGSVRSVVRFVAREINTLLEDRFTGRKAKPALINSVKDAVSALLEAFRSDSIIVDSTDPTTGARVRAYHNLKVYTTGDLLRVNVGIFPAVGINFELTDIFLALPTQSAA